MLASSGMIFPTSFRTQPRIWWTPEKGFSSTQPRPWTMPPTRVTTRSTSPTTASSMPPRKFSDLLGDRGERPEEVSKQVSDSAVDLAQQSAYEM